MTKKLEPNTIIPPELYVERAADRHLKTTIAAMGRPGYVLVARQMGKTNLLINMMREFRDDVVLYHDLTVRFSSVRAWFRNIIDALLEGYPKDFQAEAIRIQEDRLHLNIEPNIEYDRHIRLLLRAINRRIIIVLDEVDSLLNAEYSDSIMAQIRSMYFSRVNYGEYQRLTYVLSGVVEPSELIKDKNISPFNIGEKILLEDFSYEEFCTFLNKAELSLDEAVKQRIYEWAEGNPRISWDIAAAIEQRASSGQEINLEIVDTIIDDLYLKTFDRAPVDHIRTLVQGDPLIRNAVKSLKAGLLHEVDDRTRSRLYLSGITRALTGQSARIKTKIIDSALSNRWLEQIASSGRAMLSAANESYREREFAQSAIQFKAFFETASKEELERALPEDRLNFAFSRLWSDDKAGAVEEFLKVRRLVTEAGVMQTVDLYLALAYAGIGSQQDAINYLEKASRGPTKKLSFQARILLIATQLRLEKISANEAVQQGHELIQDIEYSAELSGEDRRELLISALYNQSAVFSTKKSRIEAIASIRRAKELADSKALPALILSEFDYLQDLGEKRKLAQNLVASVIDGGLYFDETGPAFSFKSGIFGSILAKVADVGLKREYDDLLSYAGQHLYSGNSRSEILKLLTKELIKEDASGLAIVLAEQALSDEADLGQGDRLMLSRLIMNGGSLGGLERYGPEFLRLLVMKGNDIEETDVDALVRLLMTYKAGSQLSQIQAVQKVWKSIEGTAFDRFPSSAVVFLIQEMAALRDLGAVELAKDPAARLLKVLEIERVSTTVSGYIPQLRRQANSILAFRSPQSDPFRKLRRNQLVTVRYANDAPVRLKFKHAEGDLRAGRCLLMDPPMT